MPSICKISVFYIWTIGYKDEKFQLSRIRSITLRLSDSQVNGREEEPYLIYVYNTIRIGIREYIVGYVLGGISFIFGRRQCESIVGYVSRLIGHPWTQPKGIGSSTFIILYKINFEMSELHVMIEHQLIRQRIGDGPISNENRLTDMQLCITVICITVIYITI